MKKSFIALALCASFSAHAFTTGYTCTTQGLTAGDNDTRASMSMSYGQAAWTIAGLEFTGAYDTDTTTVLSDGKGNTLKTNGATELDKDGSYTSYLIITLKSGKQYHVACGADNSAGQPMPPILDSREFEVVSTPDKPAPDLDKVYQEQQKAKLLEQLNDPNNKPLTPADDNDLIQITPLPDSNQTGADTNKTTNWDNQADPTPVAPSKSNEPSTTHMLLLMGVLLACAVLAKTEYKHYQLKKKMKADADKYFNLFK